MIWIDQQQQQQQQQQKNTSFKNNNNNKNKKEKDNCRNTNANVTSPKEDHKVSIENKNVVTTRIKTDSKEAITSLPRCIKYWKENEEIMLEELKLA